MNPEPSNHVPGQTDPEAVKAYLLDLQDRLCRGFEEQDGRARFREDAW